MTSDTAERDGQQRTASATSREDSPLTVLLVTHHRRFKIHFRAYPWARALAKRGHQVDVLCHSDAARFRTRVEQAEGFRIIENPDMLAGPLRQGWDPYCSARRAWFLFVEGRRYDIIHCLDTRPAVIWPALSYARAKRIPIVSDWVDWWGRGGLIEERRPWWYRETFAGVETWFEEHYRAKLDGLTTISHALLERAVALGCDRDRCLVIHGGADLDLFEHMPRKEEARARLGISGNVPVLCFSGLDVLTDLPLAVQAFELVLEEFPGAVLLLVGPAAKAPEHTVSQKGVLSRVKATGPVPHHELPAYLAAADLFLMPYSNRISNVGRWPNKIGDYMAAGRPTISNPVGEVAWLFATYDVGVLSEPTPRSMAEAALGLLRNPEKAREMGERARSTAEHVFSWDRQIVQLEDWYRSILARMGAYGMNTGA